jgi:hypothetical protein
VFPARLPSANGGQVSVSHAEPWANPSAGAEAPAAQMRALGCDRRVISVDEAVRIEPALIVSGSRRK